MGDGKAFRNPNEQTHQQQFALYTHEHCHARWWVGSAESVAISYSTLVVGCVPGLNNSNARWPDCFVPFTASNTEIVCTVSSFTDGQPGRAMSDTLWRSSLKVLTVLPSSRVMRNHHKPHEDLENTSVLYVLWHIWLVSPTSKTSIQQYYTTNYFKK